MQKSRFLGCFKELKTSPLYASALSSDSISSHIYSKEIIKIFVFNYTRRDKRLADNQWTLTIQANF